MNIKTEAAVPAVHGVGHTIDHAKMTPLHWQIWFLSSMGIFLEGYNLFVIGVALPLIKHEHLSAPPIMFGFIGAGAIAGTVFGGALMGRLADSWGRKYIYIANMGFVIIAAVLSALSPNLYLLILFQFLLGVGVGADYPICASYVSEFMPSRIRGRMLMLTFSFQALGMMTAALLGMLVLAVDPHPESSWRLIIALGGAPAVLVMCLRSFVPESPRWCIEHERIEDAVKTISKLSRKSHEEILKLVKKEKKKDEKIHRKAESMGFAALFSKKYLRQTILAAVPWFLMDIATYGVGIFTPMILAAAMGADKMHHHSFIVRDFYSTEGAAAVDVFLVIGFIVNLILVERWGRIRLQLLGFAGMFIGLVVLGSASLFLNKNMIMIFVGFILYNLLMNMGPNATTFILPAELFPTKLRASAHGFSASFAKVGAVCGIIFLPVLLSAAGTGITIFIISGAALLGLIVTFFFKIETMGKSLEELSPLEASEAMDHHT